jgi:tRNA(Ile)-lysidine synthase TilS/MesJ
MGVNDMKCIFCRKKSVIVEQQGPLCRECFLQYFQKKVYKTIRKYSLFTKNDSLCVACSGGKDSLAVLFLVNRLAKEQRQPIFAIYVDEGIRGYSRERLAAMQKFCDANWIDTIKVSFSDEFGKSLRQLTESRTGKAGDKKPDRYSVIRSMRNDIIQKYAGKLGATRIITGHNLDDEAREALLQMFRGGLDPRELGPVINGKMVNKGKKGRDKSIPVSRPLYFSTDEETGLYSGFNKFRSSRKKYPASIFSGRAFIAGKLSFFEKEFTGTKTSIVQNVLRILPVLQKGKIQKRKSRK